MGLLTDKTAVVTGGSSGIGLATAQRFIDEGATATLTATLSVGLAETVQVSASALALEVSSATQSATFSTDVLTELPTASRNSGRARKRRVRVRLGRSTTPGLAAAVWAIVLPPARQRDDRSFRSRNARSD